MSDPLRARADELVKRGRQLHRRILDPDVLRGALPLRADPVRRAGQHDEARERERRFREISPAYAQAVAAGETTNGYMRAISIDSLRWWVPLVAPDDPGRIEHALTHQHFPYRVITQTREVAIGGVMIDIGANTGRMSLPRVILGDATRAYCAEPEPLNYECLVRNVRDNQLTGLVFPDRLAIGAEDGTVRLERAKSTGGHRVIDRGAASKREVLDVRVLRLDTWVDLLGLDMSEVRFIKVDVQGSELDVLRGAARVLEQKHIAWQIEIDLTILARRGVAASGVFAIMQRHFTHFLDLNRHLTTERVRPTSELSAALSYVTGGSDGRTDVVLFNLAEIPLSLPAIG
jgi:FkbM family methyltransferase